MADKLPITESYCIGCGRPYTLDKFYKSPNPLHYNGVLPYCKDCCNRMVHSYIKKYGNLESDSRAQGDFRGADKNPQGKILYRTENLEKTHPEQHSIQAEGLNRHLPGIAGYLPHRSQKIMCTQTVTYPKSGGHTDQRVKGENRKIQCKHRGCHARQISFRFHYCHPSIPY